MPGLLSCLPSRFLLMETVEPKFGIRSDEDFGLGSVRVSSQRFLMALFGVAGVAGVCLMALSSVEQSVVVLDLEYTTGVRLVGTGGGGLFTLGGVFPTLYS